MKRFALPLGICVLSLAAFMVGRAVRASGPPSSQPLWYAGYLEKDGTPAEGTLGIAVNLWDAATDGNQVCTRANTETPLSQGRFRVALPDTCVAAVQTHADLWAEVVVGGTDFLPRSKIAAVPYAIEAANASAAVGPLDGRIAAVERPIFSNNNMQYSLHGKYCGMTASVTGNLAPLSTGTGYAAAKALCQAVSGCSASAHVCTTEEMVRHASTGGTFTSNVWYVSGILSWTWNPAPANNFAMNDCIGFSSAATTGYGAMWLMSTNAPNFAVCNVSNPLACCD
jgi:hypothetical protein